MDIINNEKQKLQAYIAQKKKSTYTILTLCTENTILTLFIVYTQIQLKRY